MTSRPARLTVATLCLLSELAMLALLVVAGWDIGNGGLISVALAVLYPALTALIWSLFVAPRAPRLLIGRRRLLLQVALFVVTAALAIGAGHPVLGGAFLIVAVAAFALASRFEI